MFDMSLQHFLSGFDLVVAAFVLIILKYFKNLNEKFLQITHFRFQPFKNALEPVIHILQ